MAREGIGESGLYLLSAEQLMQTTHLSAMAQWGIVLGGLTGGWALGVLLTRAPRKKHTHRKEN